jgi:hypothetical protein
MAKNGKILELEKNSKFVFNKNDNSIILGLHEGHPCYSTEALCLQKRASSTSKHEIHTL